MKNLIFIFTAILLLKAGPSNGQQAKAYENVRYIAKNKNLHFQLDYADGYIAASKIRLKQLHQNIQLFLPESGTPDTKGDLIFYPQLSAEKYEIRLTHINEEAEAPKIIKATYRAKGQSLMVIFRRQ